MHWSYGMHSLYRKNIWAFGKSLGEDLTGNSANPDTGDKHGTPSDIELGQHIVLRRMGDEMFSCSSVEGILKRLNDPYCKISEWEQSLK